jgi:hypothetical protein
LLSSSKQFKPASVGADVFQSPAIANTVTVVRHPIGIQPATLGRQDDDPDSPRFNKSKRGAS